MTLLQGRTRRWLLLMGVLAITAGCNDAMAPRGMKPTAGSKQISDGAHGGPNDDVFFLPPMVGNPSNAPGYGDPFQPNLPVAMRVCERDVGDENCVANSVVADFPTSAVKMSLTDQMYFVNWDTKAVPLDSAKTYQIQVWVGSKEIAYADVDVVATGAGLKRVDTGDFIGLVDGRTLPIKIRIEQGWNCLNNASCVTQVISGSATTPTLVTTNDSRAAALFPPGTLPPGVDHVIVTIEDVTPNLTSGETCKNPAGPLLTNMVVSPQCFKFTTDPKITFQQPVTIATCVDVVPERTTDDPLYHTEQLIKYDIGERTTFLRNVIPPITCPPETPRISSRSSNPLVQYALTTLGRIGRLFTPKSAYALHLGVGGLIDDGGGFSYVTAGFPMTESLSSGNGQTGIVGTALAQPFRVIITSTHLNTVPVPNQPVLCRVTSGGGTFGKSFDTTTVTTGADGIAACPILTLGPTTGTNTVTATALNIDDGIVAAEDFGEGAFPVTLHGVVPFTATASAAVTTGGNDLVVFGDANIFDNSGGSDVNNQQLFKNLVSYSTSAARGSSPNVFVYCGRALGEFCAPSTTFQTVLSGIGYSVQTNTSPALPALIPDSVKVVILVTPTSAFNSTELGTLQLFANQGGRIILLGEYPSNYGAAGLASFNSVLAAYGFPPLPPSSDIACGAGGDPKVVLSDMASSPITAGMQQVTVECGMQVGLGQAGTNLFFYDNGEISLPMGAVGPVPIIIQ